MRTRALGGHRPLHRIRLIVLSSLCLTGGAHATLSIVPTYVDGAGETWTAERVAVFEQAIDEWEARLAAPLGEGSVTINVTVDFTSAGTSGYLGRWEGSWLGVFTGDDTRPWLRTTHSIHFNADLMDTGLSNYIWWDPNLGDNSDQPFEAWDALSIARHEIGHMLGFSSLLYQDDIGTGSVVNLWTTHITTNAGVSIFDQGGLNVTLASPTDLPHVSGAAHAGDLMTPSISNSQRREISQLNLDMLELAYGYQLIPEPGVPAALAAALVLGAFRRRVREGL